MPDQKHREPFLCLRSICSTGRKSDLKEVLNLSQISKINSGVRYVEVCLTLREDSYSWSVIVKIKSNIYNKLKKIIYNVKGKTPSLLGFYVLIPPKHNGHQISSVLQVAEVMCNSIIYFNKPTMFADKLT